MKQKTTHRENVSALKRIEGQVRGIQRMVEEEKYCIDIVNQVHAVVNALYRVSEKILAKHINGCLAETFVRKGKQEKNQKINELMSVIKRLHKIR